MPARKDPFKDYSFLVEIDGIAQAAFSEVSGLSGAAEVIEYREGGDVTSTRKFPGRIEYPNVTLKRGITKAMDFWNWRKMVEDGDIAGARKNGSIKMFDQSLQLVAQWDFLNAWPSKVSGPQVQADSNAYGVEEITLVHEGIKRIQ